MSGCASSGFMMCDYCDPGFGKKYPNSTPVDSSCWPCGSNCNPLYNCDVNGAGKCDACKEGFSLNAVF